MSQRAVSRAVYPLGVSGSCPIGEGLRRTQPAPPPAGGRPPLGLNCAPPSFRPPARCGSPASATCQPRHGPVRAALVTAEMAPQAQLHLPVVCRSPRATQGTPPAQPACPACPACPTCLPGKPAQCFASRPKLEALHGLQAFLNGQEVSTRRKPDILHAGGFRKCHALSLTYSPVIGENCHQKGVIVSNGFSFSS